MSGGCGSSGYGSCTSAGGEGFHCEVSTSGDSFSSVYEGYSSSALGLGSGDVCHSGQIGSGFGRRSSSGEEEYH